MIKVSKSSDKQLKKFGQAEWPFADKEHYGKQVNYNVKEFIYKATDNNKIVGSIKGKLEAGVLYIDYLIVAHDKTGQGIGKALTQKLETKAKKLGAHKFHLITGKGWLAEKFYQVLGYKPIAILSKHHFKKDFVVYEKLI